ncbi:amidase family protein [Salinispora arenicola]|uniref:amidase family protein n=1 Tax=Salinispora arenicola TaxID=168697 RepID=UPI00037B499F|nr:amidase family protein [Salinispora arenicola]
MPEPHWPPLTELRSMLGRGELTSTEVVARCLDRIEEINPVVNAVLVTDPTAPEQARTSDRQLAAGSARPLEGIPVLVKDSVDTAGLATTAGSRLLAGAPPGADADVVRLIRLAGGIVLGKTNMSEWGNFRSVHGTEGWSAVGGQTWNPYALDHSPGGSSSGSAVAVATGMAPVAAGTDTDGSIICPAALNGVVGVRPELGLLPSRGVVPISAVADTPGVVTTTVADAAALLDALAGTGTAAPVPAAGLRIGLWRGQKMPAAVHGILDEAAAALEAAGAVVVPVELPLDQRVLDDGLAALIAEFQPSLDAYLRTRPGAPQSLTALIDANRADPVELSVFDQALFEHAAGLTEERRRAAPAARAAARDWARSVLDTLLGDGLAMIVAPTSEPSWLVDHRAGDPPVRNTTTVPSLAGYPNVSVPVGFVGELPVGVSVFGPTSTSETLPLAATVEAVCGARREPRLPNRKVRTLR